MNMFTEQQEAKTPRELLAGLAEVYREQYEWQVRVHKDGRPHKQMADALDGAVEALDKTQRLETQLDDMNQLRVGAERRIQNLKLMIADLQSRYSTLEAALATAKAECEQLKDHCLDAIKVQNEAQADALELAKEVRRCYALAQDADDRICEGDVAGFTLFGDACHEIIDDRPDTVTAAMERYK